MNSNVHNFQKIKHNIKQLQEQNELQQDQILELAHYLNLTMVQVTEQRGVLMELDTHLNVLNYTLMQTMEAITNLRFTLAILTYMHTGIQWLTSGIISLKM